MIKISKLSKSTLFGTYALVPAGTHTPGSHADLPPEKQGLGRIVPILLTECALILWLVSLLFVNVDAMNDFGLVSVLPIAAYCALLLLAVSFCFTLQGNHFDRLTLAIQFGTLLFMLYGLTALVEPNPRFHVAWRHIGIIDYIDRTQEINPYINVYFNWPGFFVLYNVLFDIAGITDPIAFTAWMPFLLNLLYLGPLYMIFSASTDDKRVVWLAIWFFYIANWVGQDYFAPQGFTLFSYLVILGIIFTWFRGDSLNVAYAPQSWLRVTGLNRLLAWCNRSLIFDHPSAMVADSGRRIGLIVTIILVYAAVVPSHQLTPIFAIAAIGLLALLNRTSFRELPWLMIILNAMWILFFAGVYLNGHFHKAVGGIGELGENVTVNVVQRLNGSPEHLLVVRVRVLMTLAIGLLGALGALRRLFRRRIDLAFVLLIVAPFLLVLVQPYGGEMVLRAYFFALAPMAFMAATCFYPSPASGQDWRTIVAIGLATVIIGSGFLVARFGNERMDYYTDWEVAAVEQLYTMAEPGSLFVVGSDNIPWKGHSIEQYKYKVATPASQQADVARILELMTDPRQPNAYYLLTRSQKAYSELFLGDAPGTWDRTEEALLDSGLFEVVYENPDARIFAMIDRDAYISEQIAVRND